MKQWKVPLPWEGLKSTDGYILINLQPIAYTIPENKPRKRRVFTFSGIQSSKNVTYDRETDAIYDNVYPDRAFTSGLVIPKSLAHEENRPQKQLKTKAYREKRMQTLADLTNKFKTIERVDKQRTDWDELEMGETVRAWQKNEPEPKANREELKKAKAKRAQRKRKQRSKLRRKARSELKRKSKMLQKRKAKRK